MFIENRGNICGVVLVSLICLGFTSCGKGGTVRPIRVEQAISDCDLFGGDVDAEIDDSRGLSSLNSRRDLQSDKTIPIVSEGTAKAVIIMPKKATDFVTLAADQLIHYVQKISGAKLAKINEGNEVPQEIQTTIHVGATNTTKETGLPDEQLDVEGVQIKSVFDDENKHQIFILGKEDQSTLFAAYTFIESFLGVRWYLPGELGEHIDTQKTLTLPQVNLVHNPGFQTRQMSGFKSAEERIWTSKQRLSAPKNIIYFAHNLLHIFKPSEYKSPHPEVFPSKKGGLLGFKKYFPKSDSDPKWQPVMTEPFVLQEAVRKAEAHFAKHPNARSFGVGINDGSLYDEEFDIPTYNPGKLKNRIGSVDLSDLIFAFSSYVGCSVQKKFPKKIIGALAYQEGHEPPKNPIATNIMPYLTYDRAMWRDAGIKKKDQALVKGWLEKSKYIGIYDYLYGASYLTPRFYPHLIDESVKFYASFGDRVRGYYAEAYPNWGLDGPKLYIATRLLWDPKADVDELLNEFYNKFFKKAKFPMKQYFEKLESIWMNMTPEQSKVFQQDAKITYHAWFYNGKSVILFTPAVIQELEGYLTTAKEIAVNDLVKRRIAFFETAFNHAKNISLIYNLDKSYFATVSSPKNGQEAKALQQKIESFYDMSKKRKELYTAINSDSLLKPRFDYFIQFGKNPKYGFQFSGYKRALSILKTWAQTNDPGLVNSLNQYERELPGFLL